jgi:transglycosylase-like protein with SLT domain
LKSLSRYLSHALVLTVTLAVGAYAAPTAFSAHTQFGGIAVAQAFASSTSAVSTAPRLALPAAGCKAPPAVPSSASFSRLVSLRDSVQRAISGCAARIEALNRQQKRLDADIAAGETRIDQEQILLAGLARDLYRQPSLLVALTSSHSLGDFFTRFADLQSASARAEALTNQLHADQLRLQQDRATVAAAVQEEASSRAALTQASDRLQQLIDAAVAAFPAAAPAVFKPVGPAAIIADIEKAFSPLGQTAVNWGLRVAKCESGYNPNAVNPYSGTEGLFQFMPSTWRSTPYGQHNVFDPWYNSLGAAWLYHRDGPSQWQCG